MTPHPRYTTSVLGERRYTTSVLGERRYTTSVLGERRYTTSGSPLYTAPLAQMWWFTGSPRYTASVLGERRYTTSGSPLYTVPLAQMWWFTGSPRYTTSVLVHWFSSLHHQRAPFGPALQDPTASAPYRTPLPLVEILMEL
jgi:hypothetical protein